jgi:hypothetical protein
MLWRRLGNATGWERWLGHGRQSVARSEIALRQEHWEAGVEAAGEAIEIARAIGRAKYDASALIVLGKAELALGRAEDAARARENGGDGGPTPASADPMARAHVARPGRSRRSVTKRAPPPMS